MTRPTLSILTGTYNRLRHLKDAIESFRKSAGPVGYEILVSDGGSTDGTREWLREQPDCLLVEGGLDGAVTAYNRAWEASQGRLVALLNDDVVAENSALERACWLMEDLSVGQVAFGFRRGAERQHKVYPIHDKVYANLGVIRRTLGKQIEAITGGIWNPIYRTYGADTELSCWVWRLGYQVLKSEDLHFWDRWADDGLRARNYADGGNMVDNKRFWKRWPEAPMLVPGGPMPYLEPNELEALKSLEERAHGHTG